MLPKFPGSTKLPGRRKGYKGVWIRKRHNPYSQTVRLAKPKFWWGLCFCLSLTRRMYMGGDVCTLKQKVPAGLLLKQKVYWPSLVHICTIEKRMREISQSRGKNSQEVLAFRVVFLGQKWVFHWGRGYPRN